MDAKDFLKMVIMLVGLIFLVLLGFALTTYLLGDYYTPFSDWTPAKFMNIVFWLLPFVLFILVALLIIVSLIYSAVKKRSQKSPAGVTAPHY